MPKLQVVAVKALIQGPDNSVLILRRAGTEGEGGYWDLPTTRVEWGEDARDAAIRVASDACGLVVKVERPVASWTFIEPPATHVNGITFVAAAPADGDAKPGKGYDQLQWVTAKTLEGFRMGDGVRRDIQENLRS
jgi:ADP-ribose pyrophosphatase YjhB (NUDIX family)